MADGFAAFGATRVVAGVWRWTAFHPEWREDVASVAVATGGGELVLVDPLLPGAQAARKAFWRALDGWLGERAGTLAVVLTVFWHRRSACEIVERYGERATLWAHERERERIGCVVDRPFRPGDALPGGLLACSTARGGEVVLWLPPARALIVGDVLLGGKRKPLRVCPNSWLPGRVKRADVARSLEHLLALPVERVLCSHGEPVVDDAHAALAAAIHDASEAPGRRAGS